MANETISKVEHEALEKVVETLVKSVAAIADEIKELKKKPVSSIASPKEEKPAPVALKAIKLEDGTQVTLKLPSFKIGQDSYTAEAVQADPVLAADLYAKAPQLFIVKAGK
jgi:hypothetical protein